MYQFLVMVIACFWQGAIGIPGASGFPGGPGMKVCTSVLINYDIYST